MANFCARVADAATRFPVHHAIELQTPDALIPTSYDRLMQQSADAAIWLRSVGVGADDRVAIMADNDARWIAVYLGALRIGAIAVPLDTAYSSSQIRTVVDNAGARVITTTPRYLTSVQAACASLSPAPLVQVMADIPEDAGGETPAIVARDEHDAAVILYTSGTTADPKGVVLTHGNLEAERHAAFAVVTLTEHDAVLGVLPLFHALAQMANLLLPLTAGARVVFLQQVSSTSLLEALQQRGITIFACVPQFFYLIHQRVMAEVAKANPARRLIFRTLLRLNGRLRDRTGWNPGRRWFARVHDTLGRHMRVLVTGGSKFDPAIGRDLYDLGFVLLNAYGLTETSGGATIVRPGDRYTTSVGHPLDHVEIRIAPPEPGADREHEDGEVLIRGPIVMREYFRRDDATREALQEDWLHTGDLGRLDEDGRLYITGRRKEMIVLASGKNLYPEEIEAHYRGSPVIKELCVLGLNRPGEPIGERLHAVIVPDQDVLTARGVVNVQQLIRFEVEGRSVQLPAHKRILTYDIWMAPLPRTTTGKLRRHQIERLLHEQASQAATPDAETPLTEAEAAWMAQSDHADAVALIASRLGRATVRPDANLDLDLALDSMERVELLTALERHYQCRVPPDVRATIVTVRQLVESVSGRVSETLAAETLPETFSSWEVLLEAPVDPELAERLKATPVVRAVIFFVVVRLFALTVRVWTRGRVSGREHIPTRGPAIICPNHQSYFDAFLLAGVVPFATLRRMFAVGAAEYYQTPLMRWFARMTNIIPVDADAHLEDAMRAGAAGLRFDRILLLFPEGERSIDGELKTFKKGASILSAHCEAPLVPVAMDGLFPLWPRGHAFQWRRLLPWRVTPVRLAAGPSLLAEPQRYAEATQALRDAVGALLARLRRR